VLQCVVVFCSGSQYILQCVAVYCSGACSLARVFYPQRFGVLQCVLQYVLQYALQCVATTLHACPDQEH